MSRTLPKLKLPKAEDVFSMSSETLSDWLARAQGWNGRDNISQGAGYHLNAINSVIRIGGSLANVDVPNYPGNLDVMRELE